MENKEFKPKYKKSPLSGSIMGIFLEVILILVLLFTPHVPPELVIGLFVIGILLIITPMVYIKSITFKQDFLLVEKFFLPEKKILYQEVYDIGNTLIKTRRGNIPISLMLNASTLQQIFQTLIHDGLILNTQLEGKQKISEILESKAMVPAGICAIVLWLVCILMKIIPVNNKFIMSISFLGFFLPSYMVIYRILKIRLK
jgi:uncharacterized membrane protein